ncbi:MAG TPA: hypothetical protein VN478_06245 [Clostridia bacterium]|nr:hypothetical protein [Clostridia bacterium]
MEFNEATQSYIALRQQLASGAITPEHFQQEVAKLRLVTTDGVWWQIDPASGAWLAWNGKTWIPAAAAGQVTQQDLQAEKSPKTSPRRGGRSRRPQPKEEPAPQTLWQLAVLMVRTWLVNLPATIISSIVTGGLVWLFHTVLLVGPNASVSWTNRHPILYWMIDTVQNPRGGVAFWVVASYFVTSFFGRLFSSPVACVKGIVLFPSWLTRGFRKLRLRAFVPFLLGGIVAFAISWRVRNYMTVYAYALGFLLVTMALDMSFEHMTLRLALSDLRRYLRVRVAPYGTESDFVFLLFPGLALGFAASALRRTPTLWAQLIFWGALLALVLSAAWSLRRKATRTAGALLLFLAVVCTVVVALTPVLADDGGWPESGRTIQGLVRNAGWPIVVKLGIPPAEAAILAGLLATNLGAAFGYMRSHGIDPTKLGLPDTPPPPGMKVAPDSVALTPEQRRARAERAVADAVKAQAEAAEANSWGGLLSAAWKNWEGEAVQIGDAVSGLVAGTKDLVVKGATSLYDGARAVYNDPSIVTAPLKNLANDIANAARDAWNDPQIIWDTASGTWKDIKTGASVAVDVGSKIVSGVASSIYTTLTDPQKMWEAIKDSGGWDNWVKSWDPNVPVLDRFGNVLIGTLKIGATILTAGQVKAAALAGREILSVAGAQILRGDFKAGARSLINGVIKTFVSGETKAAQAIADDAARLKGGVLKPVVSGVPSTGVNPGHLKTIQEGAQKFGVEVGIRPQGPISGFVRNGVPKGSAIKNKGTSFIDGLIGSKAPEGAVGHFRPDQKAVDRLIEGIKRNPGIPGARKAEMIREIEGRVADRIGELAGPKVGQLIKEGKLTVKGGALIDTASGQPVISDLDLWSLTKTGGGPVTAAQEKAFVEWCAARGVPVTHGAHMNWVPRTPADYKVYEKIIRSHGLGGKPIITVGSGGATGAANYIPPAP